MTTPRERPVDEGTASIDTASAAGGETETRGPEEIQADIEQTRQQLGETVEALTAKLDVKARTKQRIGIAKEQAVHRADVAKRRAAELAVRAKDTATDDQGRPKPTVPVGALIVVVAVATVLVWKRQRR